MFEDAAGEIVADAGAHGDTVGYLVQGTLYPDVVESGGGSGTANIKEPPQCRRTARRPAIQLGGACGALQDEVRAVGAELGLPDEIVWRHPFPGPGLAIRIIGEVTSERLAVLRAADAIAREELASAGWERDVAVPGGVARRRAQRGRPGRWPNLRPPRRLAAGVQRGRDDGELVAAAVRRSRASRTASPTRCPMSTGSSWTSRASRPAPSSGSRRRAGHSTDLSRLPSNSAVDLDYCYVACWEFQRARGKPRRTDDVP